jgi:hypothetical protein
LLYKFIQSFSKIGAKLVQKNKVSMAKQASFKRARPAAPDQETIFGWIKELVDLTEQFENFRRLGTEGDAAGRAWLLSKLAELGIPARHQEYDVDIRTYDTWQLEVEDQTIDCFFMNGAEFTDAEGVTGELKYIGNKVDPNQDLTGKIVVYELKSGPAMKGPLIPQLADYVFDPENLLPTSTIGGTGGPAPSNFPTPYYEAARLGAVGFIGVFKDRPSNKKSFYADPTGMVRATIPGVFLDDKEGTVLIDRLLASASSLKGKVTLKGEAKTSRSGNIVVHVPGQKSDAVIINTHHDAGWSGAVQDASGVGIVMALATYYHRFPSNYIQKDLYFVFNGCHYTWNYPFGANKFAEMNPQVIERTILCIGIEHIGKRVIGKDGDMVDTGEVEPRFLWTPRNQLLHNAAISAIENNNLHSTIIPKHGAIPLYGETQSYFLKGIPCFSIMSMPEYLFFEEDTIDKVAEEELVPVMNTMIDILDAAMYLPSTWITHIDR